MDFDVDMSDIQVFDWKRGGIARAVVSKSKRTSAVPASSSNYKTNGLATTSYTNQPYASSYGSSSSSSSYGSGSSSQYYYNYSANHHEQPKRIETATSEKPRGQAGWDWIDMDNIEEIDYSNMSTPRLDTIDEGVNGSKESTLSFDDIDEVDYSKPSVTATIGDIDNSTKKRVTFSDPKTLDTIKKCQNLIIPPAPRLSTNGVEIPTRSPIAISRLAVPKSSLPLSEIITDSESKSIIGSKQGDSKDRKRKRADHDGSSGPTREENDLVNLLWKSNQRVSSRLYAKPTRRVHNEVTSMQSPSTYRSGRDDSLNSSSSSVSSLKINEANVFEEREPAVCQVEEDNYPILRIRQDIFEVGEDDD